MEPRWSCHTCHEHQKSFQVYFTNAPLLPLHHEGPFKAIWLLGSSFRGCNCDRDYCIILFKSVCSPFSPTTFFFLSLPWLNNQKKVTFLRSDFHAGSMLGRHFRFPKTFHVTHTSTLEPAIHPTTRTTFIVLVWKKPPRCYEIVQHTINFKWTFSFTPKH